MATFDIRPFTPLQRVGDERFFARQMKAGETFKTGAAVLVDSNNELAECGADPATIYGVALASAADYAWKYDSFGFVDFEIPFAKADQPFRGTLKGTFAASDIGTSYGLLKDSTTGIWVVDKAETSATRVRVISVDDEVVASDVNVPCTFVFLAANQGVIG